MSVYCDILFSYTNRKEYIGLLNTRDIISMQVQRVFDATSSSPPTAAGVPPLITGAYTGINVNGVDFGTGRIISFANPVSVAITENGRHLWKQIINFEVYTSGDSGNLGTSPAFSGLGVVYNSQLVSAEEEFSSNIESNGNYAYTHAARVKCVNEPSGEGVSGFIIAKNIATGLLISTPDFGYIDAVHAGFYNAVGRRTFSETVDKMNGTASFEEKFIIQARDFFKHSVSFDNGFVNISESFLLRNSGVALGNDVFSNSDSYNILQRLDDTLGGAYNRCNALWSTYASVLGTDAYSSSLNTQHTQITKSFDEKSQELVYSVVYTNNPIMTNNDYTISREQVLSLTANGITEISEKGSLTTYNIKNTNNKSVLATAITNEINMAMNRLQSIWNGASSLKKASEQRSLADRGKVGNYSVIYTNDPSFINDGTYLTKTIATQYSLPIRMHTPYLVIGRSKPLMHNPGQTQFGNASCSISAKLVRPSSYYPASPVKPATLNQMFIDSVNALLNAVSKFTPIDIFVSKVSYVYNSDFSVSMNTEAQFVFARAFNI